MTDNNKGEQPLNKQIKREGLNTLSLSLTINELELLERTLINECEHLEYERENLSEGLKEFDKEVVEALRNIRKKIKGLLK